MKKILVALVCLVSFSAIAQQGYRYDIVPGTDNTYSLAHKEIKVIAYAATKTLAPTMEETVYNFDQLTGVISISVTITPCYTGDKMICLFHADGSDRVVTFSTGFSSAGTLTVPASTYTSVMFVFNGSAWFELSRQNLVSGSVTTLLAGNGSVGTPAISFTSDTDCGLFRIAANNTGVAENGAKVLDIGVGGLGVVGVIKNGAGTVSAPAYSYTAQPDMGKYKISSTQEGQSISGALVGGWNATGLFVGSVAEQTTGSGIIFANQTIQNRVAKAYTASATVLATDLSKGLLVITSGTDTLTLPAASAIATQIGAGAGTTFDFVFQNSASGGTCLLKVNTGIVAVSAVTGGTSVSLANSATLGIATFRLTFISSSVAILSRLN